MARNFKDLSEREILALAIALEEEDGRIYGDLSRGCAKVTLPRRRSLRRCRKRNRGIAGA
jgi:hypothetical protein